MSSIEHLRSTTGFSGGSWPPPGGMTLEENLADLRRHADDFTRAAVTHSPSSTQATTTSSAASTCIPRPGDWDVTVRSWVRADRSGLDAPLADAVARWLVTDWPWGRVDRCGR